MNAVLDRTVEVRQQRQQTMATNRAKINPNNAITSLKKKYEVILSEYLAKLKEAGFTGSSVSREVIRIHLETYLSTIDFLIDFHRIRRIDPRFAITFAADRVLGKPGADLHGNSTKSTAAANIAVLVQVLSGSDPKVKVIDQDTSAEYSEEGSMYTKKGTPRIRKARKRKPKTR